VHVACMGVTGNAYPLMSSNLDRYFRRPNVIREALENKH